MISQGKAEPMIAVMPLCYRTPEVQSLGWVRLRDPNLRQIKFQKLRNILFDGMMPAVEKDYRVAPGREFRAIAGLSLGGAESLYVGLNALDHFAWIGGFSTVGLVGDYDKVFPEFDDKVNSRLKLLWISCGKQDPFFWLSEKIRNWLQAKRIRFQWVEMPGMHTWHVWQQNLAGFAPLLFRPSQNT